MDINQLYKIYLNSAGVTTDTRTCAPGLIFFALKGETFNGNQFAHQALEKGCIYAVVDEDFDTHDDRIIKVDNVLTTLQNLAALHRKNFKHTVLQITGTNGKTTTKELTAAVISTTYNTLFTQGNFNNHIGVPLTLLKIKPEHNFAIIETGANHPGEIDTLARIVNPDWGIITNVGKAHLEGFGSFEGVIQTKTELYRHMRGNNPNGIIFIKGDNEFLLPYVENLHTVTYGTSGHDFHVEGEVIECAPFLTFRWKTAEMEWQTVHTQLIGAYNIDNALAAITIGLQAGVTTENINHALENYHPSNSRSELRKTDKNTLIVDAYNANASSMKVAIENFNLIQLNGEKKIAILGDMRELGDDSQNEHKTVIKQAISCDFSQIWLVGSEFQKAATDFNTPNILTFPTVEEVKNHLQKMPLREYLILIKGSNGTHLYELPQFL